MLNNLPRRALVVFTTILTGYIVLAVVMHQLLLAVGMIPISTPAAGPLHPTSTPLAAPLDPGSIRGIDSGPPSSYPGITWTRLSYQTCGSRLANDTLKKAVQFNHSQGVHVLLLLCQRPGQNLLDMQQFNDVAAVHADAVACGNEQMKHNTYPTYLSPADYASFFDLCEKTIHAASPGIPVLLGSLDPQVGGIDILPLQAQVQYLDTMEAAMNTVVHSGGHWSWRSQTIGLLDAWHNGYPSASVNSLQALFTFWAQQFHVNLANGELGQHLWVVEGGGCVFNCGLNSTYEISVAHILTLITDVQVTMRYYIPFFYFSGKDFSQKRGPFRSMGVLNRRGKPKPLRQDLALKSPTLLMSCSTSQVAVTEQESLLAMLYAGCTLPSNYVEILVQ